MENRKDRRIVSYGMEKFRLLEFIQETGEP